MKHAWAVWTNGVVAGTIFGIAFMHVRFSCPDSLNTLGKSRGESERITEDAINEAWGTETLQYMLFNHDPTAKHVTYHPDIKTIGGVEAWRWGKANPYLIQRLGLTSYPEWERFGLTKEQWDNPTQVITDDEGDVIDQSDETVGEMVKREWNNQ